MRAVRLTQSRADCLVIDEGRDWRRAALIAGAALAWMLVAMVVLEPESGESVFFSLTGLGVLPVAAVFGRRALRRRTLSLVRTPGRLLLNGDPLELARIELRVTQMPFLKTPSGYALTLWVMTAVGPEDILLGHFESVFDASRVGGNLEEFIGRATRQQPGRTPLS